MNQIVSTLTALEKALFSRYHQSWDTHQNRGSLDPRRCYRALGGSTDVFRKKDIRDERKSAVSIVVDLSGSMNGRRAHACGKMVDGFQEVFRQSQVNWELTGFATHHPHFPKKFNENVSRESTGNNRNIRTIAVDRGQSTTLGGGDNYAVSADDYAPRANAVRFKRFGTATPQTSLGQFVEGATGGSTADAQVYRLAMQRLAKQEESTKLMIYLGDGMGDGMNMIRQVNNEGIEAGAISMGIGLGGSAEVVAPWAFDTCIHVRRVDELSAKAFADSAQVINQLRRERCK
tara:strand:- start:75 stop:941 length:867 start_codon:yes stop_codon:yes gene_type:complete